MEQEVTFFVDNSKINLNLLGFCYTLANNVNEFFSLPYDTHGVNLIKSVHSPISELIQCFKY